MSLMFGSTDRLLAEETYAGNSNSAHSVSNELYSVLNAVKNGSIADKFDIGKHSNKHDFDNHVKIAVRECLDPSSSLTVFAGKLGRTDSSKRWLLPHFSSKRTTAESFTFFSNWSTCHSYINNAPSIEDDSNNRNLAYDDLL